MIVNTLASIDFTQSMPWVSLELLKRILWLGLLFAGIVLGCMRSSKRQVLDDRPAPWLLWGVLASLAVFLLHNMIEFGFFESGPLCMFALLAGSALGVRGSGERFGSTWGLSSIAIVAWLLMAALWVKPLSSAEMLAQAGDDDLQANRAQQAAEEYSQAVLALPLRNADYAMKMAIAQAYAQTPPTQVIEALDATVAADPAFIRGYLARAQLRLQLPSPDVDKARKDFQAAIALNPNDVDVRTDFGSALEHLGERREAAQAYEGALQKNDALAPDEPKRLTNEKVNALREKIAALEAQ